MLLRGGRMSSTRRALFILPIWILFSIWMWQWWLQSDRINYLPLFYLLTAALIYEFALLPTLFLYFVLKAKVPRKRIASKNKKVAVISLCVPSKESSDIVERQLEAMSKIKYPHESWILDEGNSREVKRLAKKYGVKHFTRKGIKKYNQPNAPFKAKTKAGNVNAWLEHVKRRKYDFFVQLDIDHIPKPDYLNKTLGYFRDDEVAWVQAPSVYKNLEHWTARGAAEQELVLQGPLQMGFYGHSKTPFIIGSHCTYRMSAINEIGGFQPTRAEDHLDTVALANKGYKGAFIPEIIAEGDGPETLSTYLAQQFAWAYSMFQVLLHHTPRLLKGMPLRKKWQFLFAQTWYPLWSLSYLAMFTSPIIALTMNKDIAIVKSEEMLVHFIPLFASTFLVWWAARPLMQPKGVNLSWRGMILHAVRWPIILRAIINALFKVKKPYMITPKGKYSKIIPSPQIYRPFVALGIISAISIVLSDFLYGENSLEAQGIFALVNCLFMVAICTVDLNLMLRQARIGVSNLRKEWLKPVTSVGVLIVFTAYAIMFSPAIENARVFAMNRAPAQQQKNTLPIDSLTTNEIIEQLKKLKVEPSQEPADVGFYHPLLPENMRPPKRHIEHFFVNWNDPKTLAKEHYKVVSSQNTPLVTIEPQENENGKKLLDDIAKGKHDRQLENIAKILGANKSKVYVRFAHEMELAKLYPWGNQPPESYKKAYRYVVNYLRMHGAENIKWVWSPAGNPGSEDYYPGGDVVDVIGTTILYDEYFYGQSRPTFEQIASGRSWLTRYKKPVWIVEFGAGRSDAHFQKRMLNDAFSNYRRMGFSALIYINIKDNNIKGPNYSFVNTHDLFSILEIDKDSVKLKKINRGVKINPPNLSLKQVLINEKSFNENLYR